MRRILGISVSVVTAALLMTGCTPTSLDPSATPTRFEPSATATASPAAAAPTVRVPLNCSSFVAGVNLDELMAPGLVALEPPTSTGIEPLDFSQLQDGQLECRWTNSSDSLTATQNLTITVAPAVTADTWSSILPMFTGSGTIKSKYPGDSYTWCFESPANVDTCSLDSLIGEYWLEIKLTSNSAKVSTGGSFDQTTNELAAYYDPILSRASSLVADAAASAGAWSPPPGTLASVSACNTLLTPSQFASILGDASAEVEIAGPTTQSTTLWASSLTTGARYCFLFTSAVSVKVSILPGGSWAFDRAVAAAVGTPVAGFGEGAFSFNTPDPTGSDSTIVVNAGNSLMSVSVYSATVGDTASLLKPFAKALLSNLGL